MEDPLPQFETATCFVIRLPLSKCKCVHGKSSGSRNSLTALNELTVEAIHVFMTKPVLFHLQHLEIKNEKDRGKITEHRSQSISSGKM